MWMSGQGYMEREPKNMGWGDSRHNKRQNFLQVQLLLHHGMRWGAPPPSQEAFIPSEVASFLVHLRAS